MIELSNKFYGVYVQVKDRHLRKFIGYVSIPDEFDGADLKLILQRWVHKDTYSILLCRACEDIPITPIYTLSQIKTEIKNTIFYRTVTKEVKEYYNTAEVIEIFKDKPFEIESSKWDVDGEYRTFIKDPKGHSKSYLEEVFKSPLKKSYWGDYYLPGKYELRDLDIQITYKDSVELQKSYSLVKITRECRIKKEQVVEEV